MDKGSFKFFSRESRVNKLIVLFLAVILSFLILSNLWSCNGPMGWFGLLLLIFYLLVPSAELRIYERGIEIKSLWTSTFIYWDNIKGAQKTTLNTQLYISYPKGLSRLARLGLPYPFTINATFENYASLVSMLKHELGDRFKEGL
jgi:hypothetical protein